MKISSWRLLKLSQTRRIVLPDRDGKQKWVEISEKFLPLGGKKFALAYVSQYYKLYKYICLTFREQLVV